MQCVTPMFRYYDSSLEKDSHAKIVPRHEVMKNMSMDPNLIRHEVDELNEFNKTHGSTMRMQTVPCGYCWACRLNKSAEWATRCVLETKQHEHNYWITLTYDEEHLPMYKYFTDGKGNYFENDGTWTGTLEPKDMDKFMNTLRQHFHRKPYYIDGIKMFYCGEYGSLNGRPHHHLLLFGAPLDMKQFYDFHIDDRYKLHWKSKEIEEWWDNGMIDITEIEWSNAAYTARYTMKKISDLAKDETYYASQGKIKEYIRMSRRPGIGNQFLYDNMKKIYKDDEIIMKTVKGNIGSVKPPRAWDRKFQELYPEEFKELKESRQRAAERSRAIELTQSDYTDLELLEHKMERINTIGNLLPREL